MKGFSGFKQTEDKLDTLSTDRKEPTVEKVKKEKSDMEIAAEMSRKSGAPMPPKNTQKFEQGKSKLQEDVANLKSKIKGMAAKLADMNPNVAAYKELRKRIESAKAKLKDYVGKY